MAPGYHGAVDRFAIFGHCVIVEGWANRQNLQLIWDGAPLTLSVAQTRRPDLVPLFGAEAEAWGFALCAALPTLQASQVRLRLNAGLMLTDPANPPNWHDDSRFSYGAMFTRFLDAVAAKPGRLLEIGSRARSGVVYRGLFGPGIDYVGLDVTAGPNVDVVADAHHLSRHLAPGFDFVFSVSVFEHLVMPWKVALEMNKVMVPGGLALIVSHATWPLHEEPWDFYRYSTEGWRGIFNRHTGFELLDARYAYPASIVPQFAATPDFIQMYGGKGYLLSGCLVRKTGDALVRWDAEVADVVDLAYTHGVAATA